MKILIYHGKYGDEYWLADSPEQLEAAMWKLAVMLDQLGCYEEEKASDLFKRAQSKDHQAVRQLLESHKDYEYEQWDLREAYEPID